MSKVKKISNILSNVLTIIIIIIGIFIYRKYDYNFFVKGVEQQGKTIFSRDSEEKYSTTRSYKIENKQENDAMFYKEVNVEKNTPYKVNCMVKTKDVVNSENNIMGGAQICLNGTEEHSEVLYGNNDWTKLEFYFNSKNNNKVEIGFRLGGNLLEASGTAWFSDLQLEKGISTEENTWNFGCFILNNMDVKLENKEIKTSFTDKEKMLVTSNMARFQTTIEEMSKGKIKIKYNIIEIQEPVTSISYDLENGYYIGEKDVYSLINSYVEQNEYDHIFVCTNMPLEEELLNENVHEWVGLGNMMYCGKGYSNIKIIDSQLEYSSMNTFPDEVFLHEFLHTLERNAQEYGYQVPKLHDYEIYGYKNDVKDGLRDWYNDYMNSNILSEGQYIGLPEEIYHLKPINSSYFKYAYKTDDLEEPKNVSEVFRSIFTKIENVFKNRNTSYEAEGVSE